MPRAGEIEVCGMDIKNISSTRLKALRRVLGIVFQDYRLNNEWSVEKNVMLPLLIGGFSKAICVKQAHILFKNVNFLLLDQRIFMELSGVEQLRVAIARALAHNPVLLLADEPTGNLDEYSSDVIWSILKSAKEQLGTTVVVVTHKIPTTLGLEYKHLFLQSAFLYELP